jgi:uncharacterized phosphosugar-binding protein
MLKIFSTQLQGIFKKIEEKEEINLEEGARLLSQALIGDGALYIHGFDELKAIEVTALHGPEPIQKGRPLYEDGKLTTVSSMDRVLLIARSSSDKKAIEVASSLLNQGISVVAISSITNTEHEGLQHLVDVHINSHVSKGLIPDETGNRFGIPSSLAALYTYYGLYFTILEILEENE